MIREFGIRGNLRLAQAEGRRFPGLLVQGDTLYMLLQTILEDAPTSYGAAEVRGWVDAYEEMMAENGLRLPY